MSVRLVPSVAVRREVLSEGILDADGTEQTLVEVSGNYILEGYVDLSEMESGDTVVIRRYAKISEGGSYRLYESETYSGAQNRPLVHFPQMVTRWGMKITIQQTAGTLKRFPYQFFIM